MSLPGSTVDEVLKIDLSTATFILTDNNGRRRMDGWTDTRTKAKAFFVAARKLAIIELDQHQLVIKCNFD